MTDVPLDKIQPRFTALSEPYWQGCREGELRMQQCAACQRFQFYPRTVCSTCSATDLTWRRLSGKGSIASFTVVRRAVSSAYEAPYIVALVDVEEGPRMMSHIIDIEPEDDRLQVGAAVAVDFQDWSAEVVMPVFRIA